jgi:hypothetical protein
MVAAAEIRTTMTVAQENLVITLGINCFIAHHRHLTAYAWINDHGFTGHVLHCADHFQYVAVAKIGRPGHFLSKCISGHEHHECHGDHPAHPFAEGANGCTEGSEEGRAESHSLSFLSAGSD